MSGVKDFEGHPIGKADKNPILDTSVYNVEYSDGENANWEQVSLQNACMLNVILKEINTGLWITLLTTERITMWFAKMTKMLQGMAKAKRRRPQED